MKSLAVARLKRLRAVELLAEGNTYEEIARKVGFTNRGSAHRAVSKALTERQAEGVDGLRQLEGDRLDALMAAHWHRALSGDTAATRIVLSVIQQRVRLFGLDRVESIPASRLLPVMPELARSEGNTSAATLGGS